MVTLTDHSALIDAILNASYAASGLNRNEEFSLRLGNVTYRAEPGSTIASARFWHNLPTAEWDVPAYSADLTALATRLIEAEKRVKQHYQEQAERCARDIAAHESRQPFSRARKTRAHKNALEEQRVATTLLAELVKPREHREEIARYDLDCRLGAYLVSI